MLAATAGIGNTAITGDKLTDMPQHLVDDKTSDAFVCTASGHLHAVRQPRLRPRGGHRRRVADDPAPSRIAPDALVGPAWPAIYTALGSVYVKGYPVIEGLLNAVHLDHLIELEVNEEELLKHAGETITLKSWAEDYFESASGRVVTIHVTHTAADGMVLARETERFAIRGRVYSDALPADAPEYGDAKQEEIAAHAAPSAAPREGRRPTRHDRLRPHFRRLQPDPHLHSWRSHLRFGRSACARHVAVRHRPARRAGAGREGGPLRDCRLDLQHVRHGSA